MTTPSTAPLSEADYYALEDALLATEKGRRFLRAYIDRNRGLETLRLLRSISRMHRAALGVPGVNAEVCRDMAGVLKIVSKRREMAMECYDDAGRLQSLMTGLEEIEACVITLIESIEDKMAGPLQEEAEGSLHPGTPGEVYSPERTAKLFGELSSFFSAEPR
jgi:hypothetical protein